MTIMLILLVLACSLKASISEIKTWNKETDFENQNNWDRKRLPCDQDKVYFDQYGSTVVTLSSKVSFKELILPKNGEIILTNNVKIGIPQITGCKGQDIHFIAGGKKYWYNPDNWNIESEFLINGDGSDVTAVPHVNRVPCQYDQVVFPQNSSFAVSIETSHDDITVNSLKIDGKNYLKDEFEEFRDTETGKRYFNGQTKLIPNNEQCRDPTGCVCHNNNPKQVEESICHHVHCSTLKLKCLDPIDISGHCCAICGSSLELKYKPLAFEIKKTRDYLKTTLQNSKYTDVHCYIWKPSRENSILIACWDKSHNMLASFTSELYQSLKTDPNIQDVELKSSSRWRDLDNAEGTGLLKILGILIGIFLAIFAIIGAIVLYRKHRYPDLNFVRFDTDVSKVIMQLGTTPHEDLQPTDLPSHSQTSQKTPSHEKKSFRNPLLGFKNKTQSLKGYNDISNPIYGIEEEKEET